jgi:two-component system repressor protein LuxO
MKPQEEIANGLERAAGYGEGQNRCFEIRPLAEVERAYIEMAIVQCGGNIPRAARLLRISPSTIYRKKTLWEKTSAFVDSALF